MTSPRTAAVRIGVDTGGTFTDIVALDTRTGRLSTTKTPSTPDDPAAGFLTGIEKILGLIGAGPADIESVLHGTTVATNQLLQGRVGALGFITTTGYESMLEIARQSVPDGYGNSYFWVKPDRIVPADLVRTVGGRLDFRGNEIRPFDRPDAVRAARFFRERGIGTLAVCFLHSYANDAHERAMAQVLADEFPDAVVSLSCEVLPEYREYERAMTTLVDAAVKPTMAQYVSAIARRLDRLTGVHSGEPRVPFSIMQSNGGVLSADQVVRQPISTVLSGPAAGALGAAMIAAHAGYPAVLTCDGGGTSTDVTVITDGRPSLTTEGAVGPFPAKIAMIDVVTVGAGGGSVGWISPEGTLKVGPRSAGAHPGPACYRLGGTEATVTDAQLVLGRIPAQLLGGEIALDRAAATAAVGAIGDQLGLPLEECAAGILEISAWNQVNALRRITTKRGLDARDFPLVTFGGSGSLLACRLMDLLSLPLVLVPPNPGNVSAYGLLTVDVRGDVVRTAVAADQELDLHKLAAVFDELAGRLGKHCCARVFRWTVTFSSDQRISVTPGRPSRYGCRVLRTGNLPASSTGRGRMRWWTVFMRHTARSTVTTSAARPNSGSNGSTCGCPGSGRSPDRKSARSPAAPEFRPRAPGRCISAVGAGRPSTTAPIWQPVTWSVDPRLSRNSARRCRSSRASGPPSIDSVIC